MLANRTVKVEVFVKDETVWLTQKALAVLFGVEVPAVNKHLKNIFDSGELIREATVSKMEIVRTEGGREVARVVEFYNLPGPGGEPGRAGHPDEDGRLGELPEQFPGTGEIPDFA